MFNFFKSRQDKSNPVLEMEPGKTLAMESGRELEILEYLAQGGQGIVYRVKYAGEEKALKWYKSSKIKNIQAFRRNLSENVKGGSPGPCFLWPIDLTEFTEGSFGYVMDLRPSEYECFSRFLTGTCDFKTEEARINAALNIVSSFQLLHKKGYSYQDLNDGNFFINPSDGNILICDNDNVAPHGENLGIAGKCRYMAPEICVGKKLPDIHTDRFSMSVILFLLLLMNHPLEGVDTLPPCLTAALEQKYYGTEPVFIFDPDNAKNRPAKGIHTNAPILWPLYPQYIKDAFIRAFSAEEMIGSGIEHRMVDREWLKLLVRLRSDLITCRCGRDNFWSAGKSCSRCQKALPVEYKLEFHDYSIPVFPGAKVYQCQFLGNVDVDFHTAVGEVVFSEQRQMWGLKNIGNVCWEVQKPDGQKIALAEGQVMKLEENTVIVYQNQDHSATVKKG